MVAALTCLAVSGAAMMACQALSVNSFWVMRLPPLPAAATTASPRRCLIGRHTQVSAQHIQKSVKPGSHYHADDGQHAAPRHAHENNIRRASKQHATHDAAHLALSCKEPICWACRPLLPNKLPQPDRAVENLARPVPLLLPLLPTWGPARLPRGSAAGMHLLLGAARELT